ncbi:MAG: hypothetical protein AB1726_16310 [Planctomycetota bacterium]
MLAAPLLLSLSLSLSLSLTAAAAPAADELADRLVELAAPESAARERAERWLAAHLEPADASRVQAAAASGDAEVRRRLARALGAADRHLGLALSLLGASAPAVREVGREAVLAALGRYDPDLLVPPLVAEDLARALAIQGELRLVEVAQVDLAAPLGESLEILGRRPEVAVALVLEPDLPTRPAWPSAGEPVLAAGPWWDLVAALAAAHGVGIEAFGLPPERGAGRGPGGGFVHFTPRSEAGRGRAGELLLRWSEAFATSSSVARRAAAARALAASGWPAALAYLEVRWSEGDEAALEGLLLAAGRGSVALSLLRPSAVRTLVARAEADLDGADPAAGDRAHRVLYALSAGKAIGPAGEELAPAVLAGWESASPRGRWLRLALLEGMGISGDHGAEARARTRALLMDRPGSVPPALLVQALRAWIVLAGEEGEELVLSDPVGLLLAPRDPAETEELVLLLRRARVVPPSSWRPPADLPARFGPPPRLAVFAWWLGREPEVAGAHLRALVAGAGLDPRLAGELAGEVLRRAVRRGEGPAAAVALAAARALAADDAERLRLDRAALLGECLAPAEVGELLARLTAADRDPGRGPDLALLGAVGGIPARQGAPAEAREALLGLFGSLLAADVPPERAAGVLGALERVLEGLFAGGEREGGLGEAVLATIESRRREHRSTKLAEELRRRDWPLPPGVRLVPPGADERRLDPERIPGR